MEISDLHMIDEEIIPPLHGGLKYAAKVQALFVNQEGERKKVTHDFGEAWGTTPYEAREKMASVVKEWIASQK